MGISCWRRHLLQIKKGLFRPPRPPPNLRDSYFIKITVLPINDNVRSPNSKGPQKRLQPSLLSRNTNISALGTRLAIQTITYYLPLDPSVHFLYCESRGFHILIKFPLNILYVAVTVSSSKDENKMHSLLHKSHP